MRAFPFRAGFERTASPVTERAAATSGAQSVGARPPLFSGSLGPALGSGGSAHVLRGDDAAGRPVALKTLKPELARHPRAELLLEHEARMLALLRHEHVVGCRGLVRLPDGRLALELEYLGGGDLVSLAGAPLGFWVGAAARVAAGLAYCHAQGVVHGDVKGRNVLFGADDAPRLVDFASGRRIADGASPQSDVHAFAALVYELLVGAPLPGADALPLGVGVPPLPAAVAKEAAAERIYAAVADALGDRSPAGLFALADVLESARRR